MASGSSRDASSPSASSITACGHVRIAVAIISSFATRIPIPVETATIAPSAISFFNSENDIPSRASVASEVLRRTAKDLQLQRLWQGQRISRSFGRAAPAAEAVKKSNMEQIVILKLPERRASDSERDARRTLKDLQLQRLWQVQRILRSFAVLRAFRSLRSLSAPAGF